ncbi:glycine--tRNA ligase subunit beta [Thioalkalivibrio sp. XN279]|uniref:glycine--tRNA ligase subunit beta n=1 Tax=Thioalkalivibrio sp. XN279 TaxID=2714953 RepID=UPI001408808C|nr:glycine--tRNA ligase subunit beta [Thioalkalivibrio sp. XN279]NHA15817.1 glycine--tRNA ligase subunit beta [Thioalkalivibrio sp. XN279]
MTEHADFLVELGTEELPPKALPALEQAFRDGLVARLAEARLAHGQVESFASPRRLAVKVQRLETRQADQEVVLRGPPLRVARVDGAWTKAAEKFAAGAGVELEALVEREEEKGAYVYARKQERGEAAAALLPRLVESALGALPVPRRMRWGAAEAEFVRPVHWLVMLLGAEVVPCAMYGVTAGRETRGHRFMSQDALALADPGEYPARLEEEGFVVASFGRRRERIRVEAETAAQATGGHLVLDPALLDEVTALVEWPVAVTGMFEERFLELPEEVLIATLQDHQRYFPVRDPDGRLAPRFITISNLDSPQPAAVRAGNERVVRPRLADAAFFWAQDRRAPLAARTAMLDSVVFQARLGSIGAKSGRTAALAGRIADLLNADTALAEEAARLAKCDLVTSMVGEFPELQGVMGRYYALADGLEPELAAALEEQYLPRFAGDRLPESRTGQALALADKLDTMAGIFAIGQRPTGNKDPFGIRRAALGVLRICVECRLDLDLPALIESAVAGQPVATDDTLAGDIWDFLLERLRGYYLEGGGSLVASHDAFAAVLARRPPSLVDFHERLAAVLEFQRLEAAGALAAANKRIANILRQADGAVAGAVDDALLQAGAEKALHERVEALAGEVAPLVAARRYREALEKLAGLREVVDRFFDEVLVMDPDPAVRDNRLALLARLRALFADIADVSRLGAPAG